MVLRLDVGDGAASGQLDSHPLHRCRKALESVLAVNQMRIGETEVVEDLVGDGHEAQVLRQGRALAAGNQSSSLRHQAFSEDDALNVVAHALVRLTLALSSRGERMRASGLLQCDVREPTHHDVACSSS
jgi:hypothetical protein